MSDVRFWVKRYLDEGFGRPHPIPKGEKGPRIRGWQNAAKVFDLDAFDEDSNVGTSLTGDLVDIDLDHPMAVKVAPRLLPRTERIHGRPGTGASHYWYRSTGVKAVQFKLPKSLVKAGEKDVLVEIRAGAGQQTLLPPSTHPSGELLAWDVDKSPTPFAGDGLHAHARGVATAALLAVVWGRGSRHVIARDAAGFLAGRDLDGRDIEDIIREAATAAGDDEVEDRVRAARDTVATFKAGGKTTGGPTLEAAIGKDAIDALLTWYGGNTAVHDGVVDELNKDRFGVRVGKDYVYGLEFEDRVVFQPARALFEEYANQKIKIGTKKVKEKDEESGRTSTREVAVYKSKFEIWREHPKKRTFRTVVFAPPPCPANPKDYNLWTGFAVAPLAPPEGADVQKWVKEQVTPKCYRYLELIHDVICSGNSDHYEYLLNLLALTVQQPGVPSEIAVSMKGEQGTGKGTFVRNFGKLFGRHYAHLDKTEHLAGKFNVALSGKVVIFADEAFFAGDKRDLGALKRLISEPTLAIERKGIDVIEEPNFVHLFMATNEDFSHQAGFNERRFFTVHVSDAHLQDHAYFASILAELQAGGYEALLTLLRQRPVTHDQVRKVPRTDELRVQQELSLPPEMKWWHGRLYHGELGQDGGWPEMIAPAEVYADYIRWCETMKITRRTSDIDLFRRTLKPWLGERVKMTGKMFRPLLPLDQARAKFDETTGSKGQWPRVEEPTTTPEVPNVPF